MRIMCLKPVHSTTGCAPRSAAVKTQMAVTALARSDLLRWRFLFSCSGGTHPRAALFLAGLSIVRFGFNF